MKTILNLLFLCLSIILNGQDTIYFDRNWNEVNFTQNAYRYKVLEICQDDNERTIEKVFFQTGQPISEKHYKPYVDRVYDGKRIEWYQNGQLHMDIDYKEGVLHGDLITFWENGQPKRKDRYINGELIEGQVLNSDGQETIHYNFKIYPEFPGGVDRLLQFLSANLRYPKKERKRNIEGRVLVNFVVERDGTITNVRIIESVSKGLDREAIRVVKRLPNFEPGMEDGLKVRFQYNLPVMFRLK
jgi:periplasmic protein TonB